MAELTIRTVRFDDVCLNCGTRYATGPDGPRNFDVCERCPGGAGIRSPTGMADTDVVCNRTVPSVSNRCRRKSGHLGNCDPWSIEISCGICGTTHSRWRDRRDLSCQDVKLLERELEATIETARAVVNSIQLRKSKLEAQNPVPDNAWQYASGCMYGALEVLRALKGE
jgi:hypothetical protein